MTRAHYPLSPYALELADEKGIVVWSEIPVYRMESTLFNKPTVRRKALKMLRTEIVRDFNHPSVAVWSIGNELPSRPKLGQQHYIKKADTLGQELDPTRLTGHRDLRLPDRRQAADLPAPQRDRCQRLLRLVRRPARHDRRSQRAQRLPQPAALRLSQPGLRDHRVRSRGQPRRAR